MNTLLDMQTIALKGSLWVLFLYDVSEEIVVEELQRILGTQRAEREPSFRRPAVCPFSGTPVAE